MPDPSWYSLTGSLMTLELGFRDAYNLEECTWEIRAMTALYTRRQTRTEELEGENDKADMQMRGHMFLKAERRLNRERD